MNGSNIAGGNPEKGRVDNDYYATNPETTKQFLDIIDSEYDFNGKTILEPAAGAGHISTVLKDRYNSAVTSRDLIDRGVNWIETGVDFLNSDSEEKYDFIMTNPPFSLAKQFIDKSLQKSDVSFIFAKIQFLEGIKRKEWFKEIPLKYVYVYSNRASIWRNGKDRDDNGKKWASTMTFAWYVFDNGYTGEPIIRWI